MFKNLLISSLGFFLGVISPVHAQKQERFEVKIKPGFSIHCLANNELTAIASGKSVLLVNNGGGIVSKELIGSTGNIVDLDSDKKGTLLAAASTSGEVTVWDIRTGSQKFRLSADRKQLIGSRFVDENLLAAIGKENSLTIWDLTKGEQISKYQDHRAAVTSLAGASGIVVTGDKDGQVVIRNVGLDSILATIKVQETISALALDHQARKIFVGTTSGKVINYDLENRVVLSSNENGRGQINHLSLASDNRHLVVAARGIKVYDTEFMSLVKEYNLVASAVIAADFSPDGENLFFIEEFAPKATCLDVSDLEIAFGMNFLDENDKTPPQIYLSSPAKIIDNRVVNYENLLSLRGSVIDDYGVRELKINGIVTPVNENGNFVINIPLSMGENQINIEVSDINQNTALKRFTVVRKNMDGTAYDPSEATNYLLVIGINKYDHWPQLYNAVKDANDVVSTLLGIYDFEFANVTLLTDDQATRSNLYNTLRNFVGKVGPKDNFMIYYSGHGYFDEVLNEGYWVPSDARVNQTGDYLSNSDISKIIANINSQHTFLVADACFSGSLFNESSRGYAENVEKFRSRWGLASGRLETVSDGAIGANSPFAQTFIGYLKTNDEEKIAISQLVQHVKVEVAEISSQTPIGNPLKGVGDEGGEFVLYKKQ